MVILVFRLVLGMLAFEGGLLLGVGAAERDRAGASWGRGGAVWDVPRGCTPDWRTSAPSFGGRRARTRGARAGEAAVLFGV